MTTYLRTLGSAAVLCLAGVLAGCFSTPAASPSANPATSQPAASQPASAPAVAASTPAAPAPSTCPEFSMTAAHMATDWHYLKINLGTTNEEGPTLADLQAGAKAMTDLAPTCAPAAAKAIAAFDATVAALVPIYTTKPTGAQVKAVDDALAQTQKAGAEMFTALGMATYAWE